MAVALKSYIDKLKEQGLASDMSEKAIQNLAAVDEKMTSFEVEMRANLAQAEENASSVYLTF